MKRKEPTEIHSDFLIIGSGLAGLYAALYASKFGKVTLLTKSTIEESNSFWAQGGIAAAIDPEDSTWFHIEDTLRAGRTDEVTGEQFCAKCGYVISEKSQASGPEWRSFQKDGGSDPARTGAPTSLTMSDMGLSTVINPLNKDASGKPLSTSMRSTIERLRTWDSRSQVHESADRNLRQALSELNKLKDKLAISANVLEKAAYIYRKAMEKNLVRGRSISAMIAASL